MEKFDGEKLPPEVRAAYAAAEAWIAEKFKGRRIVPKPFVVRLPIPEEGEAAAFHGILVPPGGEARDRITRAMLAVDAAAGMPQAQLDAVEQLTSLCVVECCVYAEGMPQAGSDPRTVARDYLKALRDEVGTLGEAMAKFGEAVLGMMKTAEVSLGKL